MTRITWDDLSSRFFEAGVDRGVFYKSDNLGVPWSGLTAVNHKPGGGKSKAFYLDGVKYNNQIGRVEFEGTIEAYTYPDEFAEYDGWSAPNNGLILDQQARKSFGLCYRTMKGNALEGIDAGYLIHLVYNVLTEPSEAKYGTIDADTNPITFSWNFSTTAIHADLPEGVRPLAHVVIDSHKTSPAQLAHVEDILYGTKTTDPRLPTLVEAMKLFDDPIRLLWIDADPRTGLSPLLDVAENADLTGKYSIGLYDDVETTRLQETEDDGLFIIDGILKRLRIHPDRETGVSDSTVVGRKADVIGMPIIGTFDTTLETNLEQSDEPGYYNYTEDSPFVETDTPGIYETE